MASATATVRHALRPDIGYRRLVVPLSGAESGRAVEIACALATEHGATVTAAVVIEVSPLLPLDARMDEEELEARAALLRAEAIADTFGVRLDGRTIRAREAGRAIVDLVEDTHAELVVITAAHKRRAYGRRASLGATVRHVLTKSPCRALVVAPPAQ
jgi:nucleotide-binding universal stress UspA family protein